MKVITFSENDKPLRLGILLDEDTIVDTAHAYQTKLEEEGIGRAEEIAAALLPADPVAFLANGRIGMEAAQEAVQFASQQSSAPYLYKTRDVRIGPPLLKPNKIVCVGLNYRDHIEEMKRELPKFPVIFAKYNTALMGPYDPIPLNSHLTQKLDYEAELAFVIGKKGKNIPKAQALDYVAGYCVVNDVTARDMQKRTIQWLQGKTLDSSLPMGPLVTKDEVADPHALEIKLSVNGEVRQHSNTSQLVFGIPELVEFLSQIFTLEPGDVICTGTPGGVGEARGVFLQAGDVVKVEISKLGVIENQVK